MVDGRRRSTSSSRRPSSSSSPPPANPARPRRLARTPTFRPDVFDLLTFQAKLGAAWESRSTGEFLGEADWSGGGALSKDGRLNATERLACLFQLLDRLPTDGGISFDELEVWMKKQAMERLMYNAERVMKTHDKDGDGVVTLREYLSYLSDKEIDWSSTEHGKPGWWKEKFNSADKDGNGSLGVAEFNDFLHPEDSSNPEVQLWLQKEKLRELDDDKDGRLSFMEFRDQTHDFDRIYTAYETEKDGYSPHHPSNAEKKFQELDTNRDNFLTAEELKPIIHRLYPGELFYATHYTKYLMNEADDDGDGKLSLQEMLNHYLAFNNTVFEEGYYDGEDDDYDYHDELR
uniref:EF-hand domain-containing protein n=1 Tax=Ananas comosus var. bracteatus TaxID=296719 RepID=A0A6V7NR66_ANACO|nr:unnamed protein product [Ananas comosus var. bracteatus]